MKRLLLIIAVIAIAVATTAYFIRQRTTKPAETPVRGPAVTAVATGQIPLSQGVRDPILRTLLDKTKTNHRIPADLDYVLPVALEEDLPAVVAMVRDVTDGAMERHEGINVLRRSRYVGLTDLLLAQLQDPREQPLFRAYLLQHLGLILAEDKPESSVALRITDALRRELVGKSSEERRQAYQSLIAVKNEDALRLAHLPLDDARLDDLRDLAIHDLYVRNETARMAEIRPYLHHPNIDTRIAAITVLGQWRDEQSAVAFREAAAETLPAMQRAGELALARLEGRTVIPTK